MVNLIKNPAIKPVIVLLIVLFLYIPVEMYAHSMQSQELAIIDAKNDARANTSGSNWFLLGCFGSVFTVAFVYTVEPSPPQTRLLGKSPEYVAAYSDTYRNEVRSLRAKYTLYGVLTNCVCFVTFYVFLIAAASSTEQ